MFRFYSKDFIKEEYGGRKAVSEYDYSLRAVVAKWQARVKHEAANNIKSNDSWFRKGTVQVRVKGEFGWESVTRSGRPLAPYYINARHLPATPGVLTERTGAVKAGLLEGGDSESDWTGLKNKIATYKHTSLMGKVRGKPTGGQGLEGSWSAYSRDDNSAALQKYRGAFKYWGFSTPAERDGRGSSGDRADLRFHFMHETGIRGHKRPYIAPAAKKLEGELISKLDLATAELFDRWAKGGSK